MEETWQAVFRNLYTGFLLRDFFGKIVPGILFLFSITSMFWSPSELIKGVKKEVPLIAVVLIAGLAWIVTLGTQSLAEGLGIWKYFPVCAAPPASSPVGFWHNLYYGGSENVFEACTAMVDKFQVDATEDEKQQYERFVVIKEACGNLFIAGLLSIPAWLVVLFVSRSYNEHSPGHRTPGSFNPPSILIKGAKSASAPVLACVYFMLVMIGLHRMNTQHVRRQMRYAEIVIENRKSRSTNATPPGAQHATAKAP